MAGRKCNSRVATLAIAFAALCLFQQSSAFIRLMGGSNTYCGYQGSACYSNDDCCEGHVCRYGYKRFGGVCQQAIPSYPEQAAMPTLYECQSDGNCPAGQCCVDVPLGVRGASIRSCRSQCPNKDFEAMLDELYSRYYRSAYYRRRRRSVQRN